MQTLHILALTCAAIAAPADDVRREGEGAYRRQVDALELQPMPEGAVAGLESWMNGEAPQALEDGPALYVTWSSWYRTSHNGLEMAQKLHERFAGDGLLVVGVHHAQGFEKAGEVIEARGISFPIAHDASGAFREALLTDSDPDFYIVDRAGHLRFADVSSRGVEDAVKVVIGETAEAAAAVPQQVREAADEAGRDASRTRKAEGVMPGRPLSVPFDLPAASAYAAVKWPAQNDGRLSAANHQGKSLPKPLGSETHIGEKPDMKGRIVVLDFWATWCGPCVQAMPKMDELQAAHPQDLVVLGISSEPRQKVEAFLQKRPHSYAQAVDQKGTVAGALQVRGIPHVAVLSSDGVIRWQGHPAEEGFRNAVKQCIERDPGVKARRAAEEEYLRAQSG